MEPPAPKTMVTVLVAGLVASVAALLIIELVDLVISRIAHHQSKSIDTEVWNYYAVRDATDQFLRTLHDTVSGNGSGPGTLGQSRFGAGATGADTVDS